MLFKASTLILVIVRAPQAREEDVDKWDTASPGPQTPPHDSGNRPIGNTTTSVLDILISTLFQRLREMSFRLIKICSILRTALVR